MGEASRESGLRQAATIVLVASIPTTPTHARASAADPMVITQGLLHQREQMEPIGESGQERGLGHVATIAPGTGTPTSPVRTPSPVVDPMGVNPGIPWWEIDDVHLEPDAH
jgi:hypothetical protein